MQKQDWLSVIITFIVGFTGGVYLYMTGGAATVQHERAVPEATALAEFTIVGEVYGGCQLARACPSFQIINNGSYRYFHTPAAGADQVLRQGTIPHDLQQQLRTVLAVNTLTRQSQPIEPALCNSYTDGIDVRYRITLDGVEYVVDSCGTDIDDTGTLWKTLGSIWDYFERSGNN